MNIDNYQCHLNISMKAAIKLESNFKDFELVFKALADETRLRIVNMLSGGELCACKILEHFKISQPTLSYHMKILCDSGLVNGRRDGAWMRYSINNVCSGKVLALFLELNSENSRQECKNCNEEC